MTDSRVLVGVSGYATAGKDTFADSLVDSFGFTKLAFADPMRQMMRALNPIVDAQCMSGLVGDEQPIGEHEIGFLTYNDILDDVGYTEAKAHYHEIRRLLQALGTQAGREVLGDSIWVDTAMKRSAEHDRVVFADLRFQNEALAIRESGGFTIRIERPGVVAANDHISEHDLDGWDFDAVIANDGTINGLLFKVVDVVDRFFPWML